ncbi:MAG: serine protease [Candidatus Bipolaricaulis anaerobius]|nr:serine protease [Candidatus Bipolaricaulis anaerobius]MDD5763518.1 serine protease [Candidatus Bipolaricaulis anaerobius]
MNNKLVLLAALVLLAPSLAWAQGASGLEINIWLGKGGVSSDQGCPRVNQETQAFSPSDEAVYVVTWVEALGTRGTYKAEIEWYGPPDGNTFYRKETITGLKYGYTWCLWRKLPIKGTEVAQMVGTWNVRVNVPGIGSRRKSFSIRSETVTPSTRGTGCIRPGEGASWQEVIELARRAVVFIMGPTNEYDEEGNQLSVYGSGVIISPEGYVLTAAHVVEDIVGTITVLVDEHTAYEAVVVKKHPNWDPESETFSADVALLKMKGVSGLPCLPLGDSDRIAIEEEIRVLGYPKAGDLGLGLVAGSGKVIGVRHFDGYSFIQFEASPFDKGHSGGPIINSRGEVLGIAMGVWTSESLEQHKLGVAINTARNILPAGIGVMDQPIGVVCAICH